MPKNKSRSLILYAFKHPYHFFGRSALPVFAFVIFVSACLYGHNSDDKEGSKEKRPQVVEENTDAALAEYTLWLTGFTGALALSTVGLWWTTRRGMRDQSEDMRRSIKASEIAARAAELQARASISVELPWLFLSDVVSEGILGGTTFEDMVLNAPKILISMTNFGRSPAFLLRSCTDLHLGLLPDVPPYMNVVTLPTHRVLQSGEVIALDPARTRKIYLEDNEAEMVREGHRPLWVFGFIEYRDFLNEFHVARFCKCLVSPRITGGRIHWWDGPSVPPAYTESY